MVNLQYLQSGPKPLVLVKMTPKERRQIQKVTQIKFCRAKRPHIEQPPSVRFHPAWYQTMLGGGPAHCQTPYNFPAQGRGVRAVLLSVRV